MWFTNLFKSEKIVSQGLDMVSGIGKWIDEQQFTDQERQELIDAHKHFRLKVLERTSDESSTRAISRRAIAWSVVTVELFFLVTSGFMYPFYPDYSQFILELAAQIYEAFLAVIAFYFASHISGSWLARGRK